MSCSFPDYWYLNGAYKEITSIIKHILYFDKPRWIYFDVGCLLNLCKLGKDKTFCFYLKVLFYFNYLNDDDNSKSCHVTLVFPNNVIEC